METEELIKLVDGIYKVSVFYYFSTSFESCIYYAYFALQTQWFNERNMLFNFQRYMSAFFTFTYIAETQCKYVCA